MIRPAVAVLAALAVTSCTCGGQPPAVTDGGSVTCDDPKVTCGSGCSDLRTDDQNCGTCGATCAATEACAGGRCYPTVCNGEPCAQNQVCVSGFCTDRSCFGVMCPAGQQCAAGICYPTACQATTCPDRFVCVDNGCVDGACLGVLCPSGSMCISGTCAFDSCGDVKRNGTETDVDCGGLCPDCVPGKGCAVALDCTSRVCAGGFCAAPSCTDAVRNQGEGDVDCGGPCAACADGKTCALPAQCKSGVCTMGVCVAPSCSDTVKNGIESDTDCGSGCPACGDGKGCFSGADCVSTLCAAGLCVPGQCANASHDGAETDVDCGGPSCQRCGQGQACDAGTDCVDRLCNAMHRCQAPTCSDLQANGKETAVDCGGGTCPGCAAGQGCDAGTDCISRVCGATKLCLANSCTDGVRNGTESDVDCGGAGLCPRCGSNRSCGVPTDCASNLCPSNRCAVSPIFPNTWEQISLSNPYDGISKDVDGDGKLDLIFTNDGNFSVSLLWGNGDAGFTSAPGPVLSGVVMATNVAGPLGVAAGDFNGDGRLDLLIGRETGSASWCIFTLLLGAGNRTFLTPQDWVVTTPAGGCGQSVTAFNYDNDGRDDVLIASDLNEPLGGFIWAGVASGAPAAPLRVPEIGAYATVADFNEDGIPDIASHRGRLSSVSVHLGLSDGGFAAPTTFPVAPGAGRIVAARLDGDAHLDLVTTCSSSNTISIALGVGDGTFLAATGIGAGGGQDVVAVDLDGDAHVDFASSGGTIHVHRGLGNGQFLPMENYGPGSPGGSWKLVAGDYTGDGKPDVAMQYRGFAASVVVIQNVSP